MFLFLSLFYHCQLQINKNKIAAFIHRQTSIKNGDIKRLNVNA